VKSPADLGKAMAELLARHRAKPQKKPVGPNVLIIEPRSSKKGAAKKKGKASAARKAKKPAAQRKPAKSKNKVARRAK